MSKVKNFLSLLFKFFFLISCFLHILSSSSLQYFSNYQNSTYHCHRRGGVCTLWMRLLSTFFSEYLRLGQRDSRLDPLLVFHWLLRYSVTLRYPSNALWRQEGGHVRIVAGLGHATCNTSIRNCERSVPMCGQSDLWNFIGTYYSTIGKVRTSWYIQTSPCLWIGIS